jgi:hypothetical protein
MQEIKVQLHSDLDEESTEQVFPVGRVVVGRRLDCDLVLDPRHALASGRHLALEYDGASLVVEDLDSTNGTMVNGARLTGRMALAPEDRVVIGKGGPVLVAEVIGAHVDLLDTIDGEGLNLETTFPGSTPIPDPSASRSVSDSRAATSSFPDIEATKPVSFEGPPPPPQETPLKPGKKPVGLRTMGSMVQAAAKRERRLGIVLVLLIVAFGAAIFYFLRREAQDAAEMARIRTETGRLADDASRPRAQPDDFQAVLETVAESVYIVIKRTEREGDSTRIVESGSGTAFSIREGFLGTNGHVADLFAELAPGETLIARSNALPSVDLRIVGVKAHPGYAGFSDLLERIRPYDKSSREVLTLPPAYDVALFEVHPGDVTKQAAPLPLAPVERVYALRSGQPVAFVGFPAEGLIRSGTDLVRPSAKTALGSINRVIDPFFGRADDVSLAHCLEYNIEVVGGASGSPIVNGRGEVVGLINAGDVISELESGRVGIGGTSYGPRSDTIRALVEGRAHASWAQLRPRIAARMLQIFRDGSGELKEHAGQVGTQALKLAAASIGLPTEGNYSWTFEGEVEFKKPGRQSLAVPTGKKGLRAIVASANGVPIGFQMSGSARVDRERLIDRFRTDEPMTTVDVRLVNPNVADETVRIEFESAEDEFFEPGKVSVFVLRVD